MALVTTHAEVTARTAWEEGAWWDSFQKWLDDYAADGRFDTEQAAGPGERMAQAMGDGEAAARYRQVFESGRVKLDQVLWREGYYIQRVPDPKDVKVQEAEHRETWYASAVDRGELKYQYGEGCLSDQLLGQWFAAIVGLGHVLPPEHVRETLRSIYAHNFRLDFFDHPNTQRLYALNDEKGLVLCSWPRGGRPALPFVCSDEVWTGIEYQVAAHLIYDDSSS